MSAAQPIPTPIPEYLRSTQIFNDYMTPKAIELVEAARAMIPRLAERAFEADNNQLVPRYDALVKDYNGIVEVHNYILKHLDDRKGTYAYLRARALV